MKVYIVWYMNPELSTTRYALYGVYATEAAANKALEESGYEGYVNEEDVRE